MEIYNRWLAAFCAEIPERVAGVALIPDIDDVDAAIATVEWAAAVGLRGGVLLPPIDDERPGYHLPVYDPLWAACEALRMPVNCHGPGGQPRPNPVLYGDDAVGRAIEFHDAKPSYRSLWFFVLGGVFERFPRLRVCFTEQLANWVPHELERLEDACADTSFSASSRVGAARDALSLTPTGYWQRNCALGATFMSRPEAVERHDIGLPNIMWGSDFPHPEGTYPVTRESLRYSFADVPPEELVMILGANAARVYDFDLDVLAPVAARVGPPVDDVAVELAEPPAAYRNKHAFRPN
jgi:predicted TIM-barrel fold metal-dependent hydrolase